MPSCNTVTTTNVNKITNSIMEKKLSQLNKMFAKLQEMTNKQVEISTLAYLLRTVTLNKGIEANKYQIK